MGSVTEDELVAKVLAWKGDERRYNREFMRKAITGMIVQAMICVEE